MTSTWTAIRAWWAEQNEGWEAMMRHQRPWEQEGPLRWVRRWGSGWELHGATLPLDRDRADGRGGDGPVGLRGDGCDPYDSNR